MNDLICSTTGADADFVCVDTADARTVAWLRCELSNWLRTCVILDVDRLKCATNAGTER